MGLVVAPLASAYWDGVNDMPPSGRNDVDSDGDGLSDAVDDDDDNDGILDDHDDDDDGDGILDNDEDDDDDGIPDGEEDDDGDGLKMTRTTTMTAMALKTNMTNPLSCEQLKLCLGTYCYCL